MIKFRPLESNDAALLKTVRLEALQDSPQAFASIYNEVKDLPASYWLDIVQCKGNYENSKSFVGEDVGKPIAMATCYPETEKVFRLIAMWVNSNSRSAGVGSTILKFVEAWASNKGAKELVAAVYTDNSPAIDFYRNQGFNEAKEQQTDTGKSKAEQQFIKILAV